MCSFFILFPIIHILYIVSRYPVGVFKSSGLVLKAGLHIINLYYIYTYVAGGMNNKLKTVIGPVRTNIVVVVYKRTLHAIRNNNTAVAYIWCNFIFKFQVIFELTDRENSNDGGGIHDQLQHVSSSIRYYIIIYV